MKGIVEAVQNITSIQTARVNHIDGSSYTFDYLGCTGYGDTFQFLLVDKTFKKVVLDESIDNIQLNIDTEA